MEDLVIRRRNSLRHHYTQTSNVLLFGYRHLSDGAKLTYQVVDSFDWADAAGLRKGFAHPTLRRLAAIRGVAMRSVRRHLVELEKVRLITRKERPGRPNLLIIEDPSPEEADAYLKAFGGVGEDKIVRPTPDKIVRPYKKKEERKGKLILVNEDDSLSGGDGGEERLPEHIGQAIRATTRRYTRASPASEAKAKREYLAREMLAILKDEHSLGYYRRLADDIEAARIFEALAQVKEQSRAGRVMNRGALFTYLVRKMAPTAPAVNRGPRRNE
jgi:DNA-binding transcriptional ArsR family regulator